MIGRDFIDRMDNQLIQQDVPLAARPLRVVMEWMKQNNVSGNFLDRRLHDPVLAIYREKYPSGDFGIGSLLTGSVYLRDRVYLAHVRLGYGEFCITPLDEIVIDRAELDQIWRSHRDHVFNAIYSVTDLWDFVYGVDDLKHHEEAFPLWNNAKAHIASAAQTLTGTRHADSVVQAAALAAELALKGTLAFLGMKENERRRIGHNLSDLADAIVRERPTSSDERFQQASGNFPDFVNMRYQAHSLHSEELAMLAIRGQYVAAESLRRISDRNLEEKIASDTNMPPRRNV